MANVISLLLVFSKVMYNFSNLKHLMSLKYLIEYYKALFAA